jgi:DNA-binding SARP family transcriptional activator
MAHGDATCPPTAADSRWRLRLLGDWQLLDGSAPVRMLRRERLLIAYLALQGSRHRCHVAGVLWPEVDERNARSSLRQSLHAVRRAAPGLVESDGDSLILSADLASDVDGLREWCDLLERPDPVSGSYAAEGLRVLDGPELMLGEFDDWVLYERERIQRAQTRALEMLARRVAEAAPLHAIAACEVAARIEPLGEGPATTLVSLHLAIGNRVDAVRAYHAFKARLWDEMRLEPSPKMTALLA